MLQAIINGNKTFSITQKDGQFLIDDSPVAADIYEASNGVISVLYEGRSLTALVEKVDRQNKEVTLSINGQRFQISIREELDMLLATMGLDTKAFQKIEPIKAPMPGLVVRILVSAGQEIKKGDGLLVLEAMKMENVLKATSAARVKAIAVAERTAVEKGTVLIELE